MGAGSSPSASRRWRASATGGTTGLAIGGAIALATLILFLVLRSLVVTRRRALDAGGRADR